jgi:hypothetical protein
MNDKSTLQQIFASYADCEFLNGEAVKDDDGTELQTAARLCENRFDDFLDEIAYALVAAGVNRDALMRVFLRHALRVLNENLDSLYAGLLCPNGVSADHTAALGDTSSSTRIAALIRARPHHSSSKIFRINGNGKPPCATKASWKSRSVPRFLAL